MLSALELIVLECLALGLPVVAANLAFQLARSHRSRSPAPAGDPHLTTIETATLGLLALLIAFTLSMAQDRYEYRRRLVVDEANAIGSAYMHAALLAPQAAANARELLRSYADARIELLQSRDWSAVGRAEEQARVLHSRLWQLAASEGRERPTPTTALFVSAVSSLIDVDEKRLDLLDTHLPITIVVLLFLVASVASAMVAYGSGRSGYRSALSLFVLPLLIGASLCVVIELDWPHVGLIRTSSRPLERARMSLQSTR